MGAGGSEEDWAGVGWELLAAETQAQQGLNIQDIQDTPPYLDPSKHGGHAQYK